MRNPHTTMESRAHSLQLENVCAKQQRANHQKYIIFFLRAKAVALGFVKQLAPSSDRTGETEGKRKGKQTNMGVLGFKVMF